MSQVSILSKSIMEI